MENTLGLFVSKNIGYYFPNIHKIKLRLLKKGYRENVRWFFIENINMMVFFSIINFLLTVIPHITINFSCFL
jgi:hypothetical protein